MRIITGKHRGRIIKTDSKHQYRPTSSMLKEALFNILTHGHVGTHENILENNDVLLDIFAGSGAISFEALSRGISKAILIEQSPELVELLNQNAATLQEEDNITIFRADATKLHRPPQQAGLCFIDPPYGRDLIMPTLEIIKQNQWLKPNALIIIETAKREDFQLPEGFNLIETRLYGRSKLSFVEFGNVSN
jgi:16S rRNA (guanine966-N2)-methyltransferase